MLSNVSRDHKNMMPHMAEMIFKPLYMKLQQTT